MFSKIIVALPEPVSVIVRNDVLPALLRSEAANAAEVLDDLQLVFTAQVVANVVVVDLPLLLRVRVLDE